MKRHVNINVKFKLKFANSSHQSMNNTDKQRFYLMFMRS